MVPILNQQLGSLPTELRVGIFPLRIQDYPLLTPINRGGFHGLSRKKMRCKISSPPRFFLQQVLSLLSLSVVTFGHHQTHHRLEHHCLHQPRPSPVAEQPPWTPPSSLCRFSSSSFHSSATDCLFFHRSSQQQRLNHQLSLLITTVTIASNSLILHPSLSSATILVACRTWTTVYIMQIIHLYGGPNLIWPSPDSWAYSSPPPKIKNICWTEIDPTQSFLDWVRPS